MDERQESFDGRDALWQWFGLSYASFLVLPRVLMHEMPDEWQHLMAQLLDEYEQEFPNQPSISTIVTAVDSRTNRFVKMPRELVMYRHPDRGAIEEMRRK